jgi:hypothetical protein
VIDRPARGLLEILQQVPDPRGREGQRHPLSAMLAAVVCATFCGFRGLRATVRWLKLNGTQLSHLLGFTRHPPVRQTFANALAEIEPVVLQRVLREFVEQFNIAEKPTGTLSAPSDPLAVEIWDGKTLRGTRKESRSEQLLVRIQMVLASVLSSTSIPANTNEPTVALDLVRQLVMKGKLVVADAAYCQRELCQAIVDQGGDYLVTVKGNQPTLLRDAEQAFVIPRGFSPLRSA